MKKEFDCIEFKRETHKKNWEKSGAKNLREYVKYVNENVTKSPLWKVVEKRKNERFFR